MADDDGLSQREKRAQRHKTESRKGAPGKMARKAIVPAIVLLVLAGVATGFWYTYTHQPDCPTHWHATFDVYVPSKANASQPEQVNYRSQFYDISGGQMPERAHMHQSDGYNQFHFEQATVCVGVREAFGYVDTKVSTHELQLVGHHADFGQAGTWKDNATAHLHIYIDHVSNITKVNKAPVSAHWEWKEESVGSVLNYQLKDMEKVLVVFGDYTPAQIAQMEAQVHDTASQTGQNVKAV